MKIGILTQPLHRNYGGILQNWALQQVLKGMGHQPEMILRYRNQPPLKPRNVLRRCASFAKKFYTRYFTGNKSVYLCNPFGRVYNALAPLHADKSFLRKINRTKPIYDNKKLKNVIERGNYNAFIVGSDQVWRHAYTPDIETFFLGFMDAHDSRKRIAFSASFGTETCDIPEENIKKCRELISRFDAISVREHSGLNILKKDFGIDKAIQTLDPILLLDQQDYIDIINPTDGHNGFYIASYILDDTPDKEAILNDVCNRLKSPSEKMSCNYTGKPMPTVSQWLATIADSEFVVTDSFHGCVFSIIFHKPFIAIANAYRGLDRFQTLLKPLGLSDRLVSDLDDFHSRIDTLLKSIDYSKVTPQLEISRKQSLDFLRSALS